MNLADAVRREVQAVDPTAPIGIQSMDGVASAGLAGRRTRTVLISAFALLTLVLAVLGVYTTIAFAVTDRSREIGIRLALGARPGEVVGMVLREGMMLGAIGCGAGLLAALAITWTLEDLLWGVTPTEPRVFLAAALVVVSGVAAASYVPTRRIAGIQSMDVLRDQ